MTWYGILILVVGIVIAFGAGFTASMLICDKKMKNTTVGDLYITKQRYEPYLVAKIPMESVAERTYVTFEVRLVDDSQK